MEFNTNQGALFSKDRTHRYLLWRVWDETKPKVLWLLCNPSIADEEKLDPTLTRVKQFSINNNFGGMIILNVFSLVSTDPTGLKYLDTNSEYVKENLKYINNLSEQMPIILGFGTNIDKYHYGYLEKEIYPILKDKAVFALKITKNGYPSHPLYLNYNCQLNKFKEL